MASGCSFTSASQFDILFSLEQDDHAAINSTFTTALVANPSFENGFSFWGKGGGESVTIMSGGASDGSQYARIYGKNGYIFQTVRVTDPGDMRGRVNYKKYWSSSTGTVWYGLYARKVNYNSGSSACQWVHNWDLNNPTYPNGTTFVFEKGVTLTPTNSWQWLPETASWTEGDPWEGVDIRQYLYNYMTHTGGSTYVRIDNMRARHLP
jgi:hypothetical protein